MSASMGPRLFSRGKVLGYQVIPEPLDGLQWGRGYSAAESPKSLMRRSEQISLQWGRGYSAAESSVEELLLCDDFEASMGPRLFSRGKDLSRARELIGWARFNGAAAIQPRKEAHPEGFEP